MRSDRCFTDFREEPEFNIHDLTPLLLPDSHDDFDGELVELLVLEAPGAEGDAVEGEALEGVGGGLVVDEDPHSPTRSRYCVGVPSGHHDRSAGEVDRPGEIPFIRDVLAEMDVERLATEDRHSTSTYRHARIPEDRAHEFADRLQALALEFAEEPRSGDTEFGLYIALFPTNRLRARKPARDDEQPSTTLDGEDEA